MENESFKEPTNEKGVFYLFSKYHKQLGFPEIIEFVDTTPDLVARRADDNKPMRIELENKSSSAFRHYCALNKNQISKVTEFPSGEWKKEGNVWTYLVDNENKISYTEETDKPVNEDKSRKLLLFESAKSAYIDVFVYWREDASFKFWEWDKEVERVNMKEKLKQMGLI